MIITLSIAITLMCNVSIITINSNSPSVLSDTPWSDDTFCFIAYGDTRSGSPGNVSDLHDDIVGLYLQHDPELILHTGDLVWHGGEWYQYADFNDSIQQVWEYDVPFYIAAGNHEMYTDDWVNDPTFTNYTAFVDYSDVAAACGGTELYYSFDANGTHFIIINTELDWTWDPAEYNCSEAQMAWLEADLQTTDNDDFVVVIFHRPPFEPSDSDLASSIREEFHTLFVSHGVDLVFNGHRHLYYRTVRDGIYYVVTGGGGAPLHNYQPEDPWRLEGDVIFSDYHYCVAKFESGNLNVEVILMNGTIRDSFSLAIASPSTTPQTTTTTITTTPTTPTDLPPDNTMLYLAIGGGAILIVLVILYLGSKRK